MHELELRLDDGRTLAAIDAGHPEGYPVFYMHGTPGSRHEPLKAVEAFPRGDLRLITLDRPGYGGSTPCDDYTLADHAADVAALADHLGIGPFAVLGFSAGAVFAMATASVLGPRVRRVVLAGAPAPCLLDDPLAGTGQLTRSAWQLGLEDPEALPKALAPLAADGETLVSAMVENMPLVDRNLVGSPENARRCQQNFAATVAQGPEPAARAMARDIALMMRPWGFHPAELDHVVHVFHGGDDGFVAQLHGRALAEAMPNATLEVVTDSGHYDWVYGNALARVWSRAMPDPA